jgi:NO-binding membrane sensor protein with MHYT domain
MVYVRHFPTCRIVLTIVTGMNFIGNRAIVLGDDPSIPQISYYPSFTAISLFMPIIVLFLAFVAIGSNDKIGLIRLPLGGLLSGLGIVGYICFNNIYAEDSDNTRMHYLGQARTANYICIYDIGNIVGAVLIALVASTAALGTFFLWRSQWSTSQRKRAFCAAILALAVSGYGSV